jgi:putative addiction module component (TIGR02574 family)
MSVDTILKEIEALSETERAELLHRLAARYPERITVAISPELAELLDSRTAAHEANPGAGYTMEEVVEFVKRQR